MGLNKTLIQIINKFLLGGIKPDLTILNLVSKENLSKRLKKRKNKNRYDKFSYNFYSKVQKGFLSLSKNKTNYFIVNSDYNIKVNKKKILNIIKKKFNI